MNTTHTATTIDTLTTALTGNTAKRAASKAAAIERFLEAAGEKGIDGAAILAADQPLAALTEAMTPEAEEVVPHIPLMGGRKAALALVEEDAFGGRTQDELLGGKRKEPKPRKERSPKAEKAPRGPSKIDAVVALLRRPEGAAMDEIMTATGWLAHTARAAISVQIKKKLGLTVETSKAEGRGTIYRAA